MIYRPPFGAGFFSEHKMIIGLTGRKRSGKSTIAQALVHKGFTEFSFAEPIRTFTKILLGLDHAGLEEAKEQPVKWLDSIVTPRYIMQTLGTEWGRQMIHPDIWIRYLTRRITAPANSDANIVISDIRFDNEAIALRELGAKIVRVERPGGGEDWHSSEHGVALKYVHFGVMNNGELAAVNDIADLIVEKAK
jgi:hypothetical protein